MSKAKEMFEELGYHEYKIKHTGLIIGYQYGSYLTNREIKNIHFYENNKGKTVQCSGDHMFKQIDYFTYGGLTPKEIQAIHQQMKELGWLDEL